jgi:arsenate reductase-like glutaredoxin family protein
MTCKKAQGFLAANEYAVAKTSDANKRKIGPRDALKLLEGIKKLVSTRGKNVVTHDLVHDRPDDETLLACMIGPSGNLRAPTVRIGSTLVVGYNEETYRQLLGA